MAPTEHAWWSSDTESEELSSAHSFMSSGVNETAAHKPPGAVGSRREQLTSPYLLPRSPFTVHSSRLGSQERVSH